ncbi:MAG TPA: 50S ribosomal protein L30 [Fibrobacteria bacterium]|jgi:large subunit ribosomal protein L30|nr:50S ribosomal protein L30 [Fibrobacteria bacterium]
MSKKLEITQTRSTVRSTQPQIRTIEALGLRRIRHSVVQPDNVQIRGMLRVVNHLVSVKEVEA